MAPSPARAASRDPTTRPSRAVPRRPSLLTERRRGPLNHAPRPIPPSKREDFYRDRRRRKVCSFCADKTVEIDYKEVNRLRRYLSERAKIEPRRKTGTVRRPPARAGRRAQGAHATSRCCRTRRSTCGPAGRAGLPASLRSSVQPALASRRRFRGRRGVRLSPHWALAGLLIVPLLTLVFGLSLREAVGVSLVSVIITAAPRRASISSSIAATLRLGISLELFTAAVPSSVGRTRSLSTNGCSPSSSRPPRVRRVTIWRASARRGAQLRRTSSSPSTARRPMPAPTASFRSAALDRLSREAYTRPELGRGIVGSDWCAGVVVCPVRDRGGIIGCR